MSPLVKNFAQSSRYRYYVLNQKGTYPYWGWGTPSMKGRIYIFNIGLSIVTT